MTEDRVGPELDICLLCGCIGLEERVKPENHDCEYFVTEDTNDAK